MYLVQRLKELFVKSPPSPEVTETVKEMEEAITQIHRATETVAARVEKRDPVATEFEMVTRRLARLERRRGRSRGY